MPDKKIYPWGIASKSSAAMTALSIERVHTVTFNTINFDPLIHPSIQRHDDYDKNTHLSVCVHIIKNEECRRQKWIYGFSKRSKSLMASNS